MLRGLDETPPDLDACVVTVGVFDGVHRGHQRVVGQAVSRASELRVPAVAVTFDPRPVEILAPDKAPPMLTTVGERIRLLGALGVDTVLALRFNREFSQLAPGDFVRATLVDALHARVVVVGEDFRFGHRAAGDVTLLHQLGAQWGFSVEGVPAAGERDVTYSSSAARDYVASGDMEAAARILGRPHGVAGTVERGDGRGRDMGYPTANISCPADAAVPADGVYAGWLCRAGEPAGASRADCWPAAISIGTNPTFAGAARRVEAYALDRDDLELYDERVIVAFVTRLRETLRFDSTAELVDEMASDVEAARQILGDQPPGTLPDERDVPAPRVDRMS